MQTFSANLGFIQQFIHTQIKTSTYIYIYTHKLKGHPDYLSRYYSLLIGCPSLAFSPHQQIHDLPLIFISNNFSKLNYFEYFAHRFSQVTQVGHHVISNHGSFPFSYPTFFFFFLQPHQLQPRSSTNNNTVATLEWSVSRRRRR